MDNLIEKSNLETKKVPSLSGLTKIFLALVIIRLIFSIITNIVKLTSPETIEYNGMLIQMSDHTISIWSIIFAIIAIFLCLNIILLRKWAVLALFAIEIVQCVGLSIYQDGNFFYNLGINIVGCILPIFLLSLLLFIRNDGISGWKAIFSKDL